MPVELMLLAGQILLKYGPAAGRAAVKLFGKEDVKPEDFDELFDIAERDYAGYVAGTHQPIELGTRSGE
jgi:hypothetical protein